MAQPKIVGLPTDPEAQQAPPEGSAQTAQPKVVWAPADPDAHPSAQKASSTGQQDEEKAPDAESKKNEAGAHAKQDDESSPKRSTSQILFQQSKSFAVFIRDVII